MFIPQQTGRFGSFKSAYGNFIDGKFVEPLSGEYFMNTSPVDGSNIAQFPVPTPKISIWLLMRHTGRQTPGANLGTAAFSSSAAGRRPYSGESGVSGGSGELG